MQGEMKNCRKNATKNANERTKKSEALVYRLG